MKKHLLKPLFALGLFCLLGLNTLDCSAQGTAFTYQGKLNVGTNAATGLYDFHFILYDGNNYLITVYLTNAVPVTNGLFTVPIDFGSQFTGGDRWMQISMRTNNTGSFTFLTPLQHLTPTPYAIMAGSASNLLGNISSPQLPSNVALLNANQTFTGANTFMGYVNASVGISGYNSNSPIAAGVSGYDYSGFGNSSGVLGTSSGGKGMYGVATIASPTSAGVWGESSASGGTAIVAKASGSNSTGIYASGTANAAVFNGNVKIGTNAQNFAVGSGENLRIVRGNINADGTIANGSGFTVTRLYKGAYEIDFNPAFGNTPTLTASVIENNATPGYVARVSPSFSSRVDIFIYDYVIDLADNDFCFIAIGSQ